MTKNLKYPIYLFALILISKIGYIVVESFYNLHVLTVTTDAHLTKEILEELNTNGHKISAIGITLLIVPFLYFLVKKLPTLLMSISLSVLSVGTYFIAYEALNVIINKVVESNKDKRHDAYYINIFKYGVLNNVFAYNSFIDNQKIVDNNLDVNDRILLTNSFLMLSADENLITKLKEKGKDKVAEAYFGNTLQDDYNEKYELFKKASLDIKMLWEKFNFHRTDLNSKLESNVDESKIQEAYKEFQNSLIENYNKYALASKEVALRIREETKNRKISPIYKSLQDYFKYAEWGEAKRKYEANMIKAFGHNIEPTRWKDRAGKLTPESIAKVIGEEISLKAKEKMNGLPAGLKIGEFLNHDITKLEVSKRLKEKNILITYDFDYSYIQFKEAFNRMFTDEYNNACNIFYSKLKEEIGENDLKLDMDWNSFVRSDYIRSNIKTKLKTTDKETIDNIIEAFRSKDLANFRTMVYMKSIADKIQSKMYTKEMFENDPEIGAYGDDAIRLLYVPPFALSISIIALLLNIVTVFSMLMSLSGLNPYVQKTLKAILVLFIILIPLSIKYESLDNELIRESTTENTKMYLSFLGWISYYEKINFSIHN